jgi:Zn-dependent protease with chaperone function
MISVTFPVLALIVTLASLPLAYIAGRFVVLALQPARGRRAVGRADLWFARGVAPASMALVIAVGVVLPAFVLFEPRHEGERVGPMMVALAAIGALHVIVIAIRFLRMVVLSRRWAVTWLRGAEPLPRREWGLPAFAIDAGFPVVAVWGVIRPRLFVDRRVIGACSPAELAAIAAHERAHVTGFDNLRRLLIGACEGPSSAVAHAWRQAAEQAADERAVDTSSRALDLASALLKVARLAPPRLLDCTALSTIHDGGALELRVQHLLSLEPVANGAGSRLPIKVLITAVALMILYSTPLLGFVYSVVEAAVKDLL